MIEAENLTRKFGDFTAVEGLTFRVDDGEIFGFLGPNGAGKTTTVRMLTCLIGKTSGAARVGGHEIGDPAGEMAIRRRVGLVPDNVGLYEELTGYENLDFFAKMYGCPAAQRREGIERFLRMLGLWEQRGQPIGTFSKGMKQKIAIARALVHDPDVLFLDEPTASLDPESAKTVRDFILELKKQGKTIFLNTHNLDEAQRICDRIAILNTRMMTVGTPAELERAAGRSQVVFQVEHVTESILGALVGRSGKPVTQEGNRLTLEIDEPERENPALIEAIVRAGGRVQFVSRVNPSLEDAYLRLVRRSS